MSAILSVDETPQPAPGLHTGSVLVPDSEIPEFTKRLRSLNAKATKLGLADIVVGTSKPVRYARIPEFNEKSGDFMGTYLVPYREHGHYPPGTGIVLLHRIELEYPILKLGDWHVVAQIEALPAGSLVFTTSRDEADLAAAEKLRDCPVGCEHCNTKRNRKLGFLLRNEQGEYKAVGSTCVEDFTGVDPSVALFMAQMSTLAPREDDEIRASRGTPMLYARDFLAKVAFLVETGGFVSSTKARDTGYQATYELASNFRMLVRDADTLKTFQESYERLCEHADTVIAWSQSLPGTTSYEQNLKVLLATPELREDRKHLAIAASAVSAYARSLADANRRQVETANPSQHIGTVGQKLETKLTLMAVIPFETRYGWQYRINMQDPSGNKLSWKTASPPDELREAEAIGKSFTASFKVKDHGEFRDAAVTEVSHLKVVEFAPAPVGLDHVANDEADDELQPSAAP